MDRKLKYGMVGGGVGAFIGGVHRMAAELDGQAELVCGAFSSTPERSKESGKMLYLPDNRVYGTYEEMIQSEAKLPEGERMDFVVIVTPNFMHVDPAIKALEAGFPVVCDKPMAYDLAEAKKLQETVKKTGKLFALTHNYTGYPMVKQARKMVRGGEIGKIRKIVVEYPQGWLATKLEETGQKQADWRTDPKRSGAAGCMGDIGTHAENLAEYISGLKIKELCADLSTFVPGRKLDDDGNVLLRFDNGAKGILWASQIAIDEENQLNIRIYGDKGAIEWHQEEPNTLVCKWLDKPREYLRTGTGHVGDEATTASRIPAGHPEGFVLAFANVYKNFIMCLKAELDGEKVDDIYNDFPTVDDGVRGMAFIESVVESSNKGAQWLEFKE